MNEFGNLKEALARVLERLGAGIVEHLPNVLGAIVLIVVGWLIARVMRSLTIRGALLVDALIARLTGPAGKEHLRIGRSSLVLGAVAFWVVLLFFAAAATQILGLQAFTAWLARLIDYLPTLAAGMLIVAVGHVLSRFAADVVRATATGLAIAQRLVLARLAQIAILIGAILVGADQIGIEVTFLAIFAGAGAAAIVGGVAIAVGFGAREWVANLIGAHYLRQAFAIGQIVRVSGHQGRILEVTATALILETDDGRLMLPGRVYHNESIAVLTRGVNG